MTAQRGRARASAFQSTYHLTDGPRERFREGGPDLIATGAADAVARLPGGREAQEVAIGAANSAGSDTGEDHKMRVGLLGAGTSA